ncbi:MAG: glucoamylase family protein [Bacteroidales bacterium]|nr:glucoamylase family protein [Bacteroidales bacterium]
MPTYQINQKPIMIVRFSLILFIFLTFLSCKKEKTEPIPDILQIASVKIGTVYLDYSKIIENNPIDKNILITFNSSIDTSTVKENVFLKSESGNLIMVNIQYSDENKTIVLTPIQSLENNSIYNLEILIGLKGANHETFAGITYTFKTIAGTFKIDEITINSLNFSGSAILQNVDFKNLTVEILFSEPLSSDNYQSFFSLSNNASLSMGLTGDDKKVTIKNTGDLEDLNRYVFTISQELKSANGYIFNGFSNTFYTSLDSTYKFPLLSDDQLLTKIQQQTFKYFWDFAHPFSGLIRDRNTSGDVVTISGTGFGIMSIIVGIERNFITRTQGIERLETILNFLELADRFHGAWPHWLNGSTGKVIPFSTKDDGGDLVETTFLVEGLLTLRQYLNAGDTQENALITKINELWQSVEWDWYTQGGQNVLYWHWSPNYNWEMNHMVRGYNEAINTYILAKASPDYSITNEVYTQGWANNGAIVNGNQYYDYTLPLGEAYGGPMFYEHYSFIALDPRNLNDTYANYWNQAVNHTLINWAYCVANPKNYVGYSADCWGLTASDNHQGYSAHSPTNDLGVISPTAAIASIPYAPEQSINAIKHFYYLLGNKLWGEYGFYDAFNVTENWWADSYLAIDQGPIILMIENYRTGLLWDLFMSAPEVQNGLTMLGFSY